MIAGLEARPRWKEAINGRPHHHRGKERVAERHGRLVPQFATTVYVML
jgi:hypothetical protein